MQTEFEEEIREFLIESNENLAVLDQQLVQLEQNPENDHLISSIFRTIHSIKGTCSFFGFDVLGSVAHRAESILMQLRDHQRSLTPELISLILEAIDAVKVLLGRIETTGAEGEDENENLRDRLDAAYQMGSAVDPLHLVMKAAEKKQTPSVAAVDTTQEVLEATDSAVAGEPVSLPAAPDTRSEMLQDRTSKEPSQATAAATNEKPTSAATDGAAELAVTDSTIRVDVNLLNQLMNMVGELVLTRNQLLQAAGSFSPAVQQTSQRLNSITTELQEGVMKTRMQPIGVIWSKLPRVVRDIAAKCGKQIQIEMSGAETELDKSLIEAIRDPLTHIVRNSCDHGIEQPAERLRKGKQATGILSLRAFHEAGAVNIEISDDGAGIDPARIKAKAVEKNLITPDQASSMSPTEAVNLVFVPGFSTAAQVTSLSGRGVGMDVVKTNIEKISGSVEVALLPQGGTIIKIKIPLTLAIIPGLIVSSDARPDQLPGHGDRFVIPQSHLVEMTQVDMTSDSCLVETVHGAAIFRHRGKLLPLIYLSQLLKRATNDSKVGQINVIILQVTGRQFGLVVDSICDTQEIVVKPLGQQLKQLACYGGATIMGDGRPALILDVGGIARLAGLEAKTQQAPLSNALTKSAGPTSELLLFRAGDHHRLGLPLSIVNRLEEILVESMELAAGQHVVSYRGELLPLFHVAAFLQKDWQATDLPKTAKIKVVVINNGDRRLGLIVDEIIDIVEGEIDIMRSSTDPLVMGSAVIGGSVTDLLDVSAINDKASQSWSRPRGLGGATRRVLFYDPQPISREMTRTLLGSAGYAQSHISSAAEGSSVLNEGAVDVMLVADTGGGVPAWWTTLRTQDSRLMSVPQIVVKDLQADVAATNRMEDKQTAAVHRQDRASLLQMIAEAIEPEFGKRAA